jgi:hypothetical protein
LALLVLEQPHHRHVERSGDADQVAESIEKLFEHGKGNSLPGVAGTPWAAYSGVTEYLEHRDSRRDGVQQLKYIWYGNGADLKAKVFDLAVAKTVKWNPALRAQVGETAIGPV